MTPKYLKLIKNDDGVIKKKIATANEILKSCVLCPRECKVDRSKNELGICRTGKNAYISSIHSHFGEEAPLVGKNGSGTIFITYCNLMCNFCQNFDISHEGIGNEVSIKTLAQYMLTLQNEGCHNINFVTPTHVIPQIIAAIEIAAKKGLNIPIVYNTGSYDRVEILKILDGIIDIYMPDFKFWDNAIAKKTCNAEDYPEFAKNAIKEMHRQVGDLIIDESGIARRGLIVRHLVLPKNLAGTRSIMHFLATQISKNTYVNIMPQYRPCGKAFQIKDLSSHINNKEFIDALDMAKEEGIERLDMPFLRELALA